MKTSQRQNIINHLLNDYSKPYNRELELLKRLDQARFETKKPKKENLQVN